MPIIKPIQYQWYYTHKAAYTLLIRHRLTHKAAYTEAKLAAQLRHNDTTC